MLHLFCCLFLKGTVLLVDVEVIVFMEIIAHVDVRIAVVVDITDANAEPISSAVLIIPASSVTSVNTVASIMVRIIAKRRSPARGCFFPSNKLRLPNVPFWYGEWLS
ncbi:MAG: hypothetical protein R2792_03555 [Saprospiraceae bacterium]